MMNTSILPKYRKYHEESNCTERYTDFDQIIDVVNVLKQRGLSVNPTKNTSTLSGQDLLLLKVSTGNWVNVQDLDIKDFLQIYEQNYDGCVGCLEHLDIMEFISSNISRLPIKISDIDGLRDIINEEEYNELLTYCSDYTSWQKLPLIDRITCLQDHGFIIVPKKQALNNTVFITNVPDKLDLNDELYVITYKIVILDQSFNLISQYDKRVGYAPGTWTHSLNGCDYSQRKASYGINSTSFNHASSMLDNYQALICLAVPIQDCIYLSDYDLIRSSSVYTRQVVSYNHETVRKHLNDCNRLQSRATNEETTETTKKVNKISGYNVFYRLNAESIKANLQPGEKFMQVLTAIWTYKSNEEKNHYNELANIENTTGRITTLDDLNRLTTKSDKENNPVVKKIKKTSQKLSVKVKESKTLSQVFSHESTVTIKKPEEISDKIEYANKVVDYIRNKITDIYGSEILNTHVYAHIHNLLKDEYDQNSICRFIRQTYHLDANFMDNLCKYIDDAMSIIKLTNVQFIRYMSSLITTMNLPILHEIHDYLVLNKVLTFDVSLLCLTEANLDKTIITTIIRQLLEYGELNHQKKVMAKLVYKFIMNCREFLLQYPKFLNTSINKAQELVTKEPKCDEQDREYFNKCYMILNELKTTSESVQPIETIHTVQSENLQSVQSVPLVQSRI